MVHDALLPATLRGAVRGLDRLLRRLYRIEPFTDDPECIFRIAFRPSPVARTLADGTVVRPGDPLLELHFWNEHLPPMGPAGPDLAWGQAFTARLRRSLALLARFSTTDPRAREVVAAYGRLLLPWGDRDPQRLLLHRLGFTFVPLPPPRTPWARIATSLIKGYTWALIWTYNPGSLAPRSFGRDRLVEVWISRRRLEALGEGEGAP